MRSSGSTSELFINPAASQEQKHPGCYCCEKEKPDLGLFLAASDNPEDCFRAECFLAGFIVLSTWGNQLSGGLILLEGINTAAFPKAAG